MVRDAAPARAGNRGHAVVLETALYTIVVVCTTWPALTRSRDEMLGGSDDARYYAWLGWRVSRLIADGHVLPAHIPDVIAPFGLDARLLDGYLPTYVCALWNLVTGPVLAYNLTLITGVALNLLAARALARRLTGNRAVVMIGAVAFATAPALALNAQVGVPPLLWAWTLPLFVGEALDVVTRRSPVRPVRLALLFVAAYLCSIYFLVFGAVVYAAIVFVGAVRDHEWRPIAMTALSAAAAFVLLTPFVVPRLTFDREDTRHDDDALLAESNLYSADALSLVAQPTRSTVLLPRPTVVDDSIGRLPDPTHALESTLFPGFLVLGGFVTFMFVRDRRRLPLAVAAAAVFVLALGPSLKVGGRFLWRDDDQPVSWLPFRLLSQIPGLGALRAPARASYALVAVGVAATVIVLERLLARAPQRAPFVVAASVLLLGTNLLIPLPSVDMQTTPTSDDALRQIARIADPGDTVLRVPADCDPDFVAYQLLHHTASVGCAGSSAANPWHTKMTAYAASDAFTKLRCDRRTYGRLETTPIATAPFGPDDVDELRAQFGVRFLIVDRARLGADRCPAVHDLDDVLSRYEILGADDRFAIIDLSGSGGDTTSG
ncbi:MAG TPA: hypothetical protein VFX21_06600 [Acidimicrobiia bacterium]|nr:hypothetical protein [Acidimicrobiia bacterium]